MKAKLIKAMLVTVLMTGCVVSNYIESNAAIVTEIKSEKEATDIQNKKVSTKNQGEKEASTIRTEELVTKIREDKTLAADMELEAVYVDAVKNLLENNVLPDNTKFENYAPLILEKNKYAICDIDNDDSDELLINISDTCTAGMVLYIYDYDEATQQFTSENWLFPVDCHIYDNGFLTTSVSHSGGVSDDENWPYKVYRYNPKKDEYILVAEIEPWVDNFSHIRPSWGNEKAEEFPTEVDTDNCGIVYGFTFSNSKERQYCSRSVYLECMDRLLGKADEITIEWIPLSEIQ